MDMLPPLVKQILDNFNLNVDPTLSREQNTEEVIKSAAMLSGAIAVEPLPFADILLLTPLQAKMVLHIGKIYGFDITPERAKDILQELGATVAYGFVARQVMRGVAKIVLPVIGGLITAPAVYAWTFALGKLSQQYFESRATGQDFGKAERKRIASEAREQSKKFLPSAEAFSGLADELRRRAEKKSDKDKSDTSSDITNTNSD